MSGTAVSTSRKLRAGTDDSGGARIVKTGATATGNVSVMTTNTTRTGRLQAVVLDSARPAVLAEFYRDLLGGEISQSDDDQASLTVAGGALSFQRVPDGSAPVWPGGGRRLHLDVVVPDLDAARDRVVELGGRVPADQPGDGEWTVLLDSEGHPFCLMKGV